jgi:hypothetical protein
MLYEKEISRNGGGWPAIYGYFPSWYNLDGVQLCLDKHHT